jgi:uncharacterized membrane protein
MGRKAEKAEKRIAYNHIFEEEILKELHDEEKEIIEIKDNINILKNKLTDKQVKLFGKKDIINSSFSAFLIGLTFAFKGLLIEVGMSLPWKNVFMIIAVTLFLLTTEIYFIGYSRVKNKKERPFGEFLFKRLVTMYIISFLVSFLIMYLFGFMYFSNDIFDFLKLVFIVAMPSAVGAAIPGMLKPKSE